MAHVMHMTPPAMYTPEVDVLDRHKYGVSKSRKPASTGGGRAWSDDEEVYLLQTRLQKMPYKHIAAHLKKTELACRLHYHQLSHGSNRRKRTASVSSGSSVGGHSPLLLPSVPSPIHEHSPTPSPPGSSGSYSSMSSSSGASGIQLPSIVAASATSGNNMTSPRLPTILPKPISMTMTPTAMTQNAANRQYSSSLDVSLVTAGLSSHNVSLLPAASFTTTPTGNMPPPHSTAINSGTPNLRLDCSSLPPPPLPFSDLPHSTHSIDMARLQAIYLAHRHVFWEAIAVEYGPGYSPSILEQAWRSTGLIPSIGSQPYHQTATPLTPGTSSDDRDVFYNVKGTQDKTRISAILGIDANPRSPKEREIVRRMEEERVAVSAAA